jgi:hypothetical protein
VTKMEIRYRELHFHRVSCLLRASQLIATLTSCGYLSNKYRAAYAQQFFVFKLEINNQMKLRPSHHQEISPPHSLYSTLPASLVFSRL